MIRAKPKYASRDAHAGPWSSCSTCGLLWSQRSMQFQYDFQGGAVPINRQILRCPKCIDALMWQAKLLIIPPDPPPFFNTRPEPYAVDETTWLVDGTPDASGDQYSGDIITTGVTSDSGPALIPTQPNPADNADTSVLSASLSYVGSLSVAYLDLFNGNPTAGGTSILLAMTGSATRTNVFDDLESTGVTNILENPDVITVVASSLATINVTHIGIYSAASGGTLLVSGAVSATFPTIVLGAAVQFNALGLQIQQS